MNLGIIGSGNVGGTLGTRWARNGHAVRFGFRDPGSAEARELIAAAGPNASAGDAASVAAFGEVIVVATPYEAAAGALRAAGSLAGKTILDATNPLLPGLAGLSTGTTTSAAETIQAAIPEAHVVKIFNTVGFNIMENPDFGGPKPVMFYCGDDTEAKRRAGALAVELGFDAVDAGPLKQARTLEPFAMLWISLALQYGLGRDIAFALLRR